METQSVTQLLTELIAIPSVNPAHDTRPEVTGEARMADYLEAQLSQRGFHVERRELMGPDRPAVIGRLGLSAPVKTLMFGVHLDTVGVSHMTIPPFEPEVKDGKVYGRGACDMKGSTAALLAALTPETIQACRDAGTELILVGTPDEECGTVGAKLLADQGLGADQCIVLEPTRNHPVIAHHGCRWYDVHLHGVACHGSQPQNGVSTNVATARLLPEILRAHKALQGMHNDPALGTSTLNIGKIDGGHAHNIVPDHTTIGLDRRVLPSEPPVLFEQALAHVLDELKQENLITTSKIESIGSTPSFATATDSDLVNSFSAAIADTTGAPAKPFGTAWVSDASQFSRTCPEILVWGPGDIAQAHTEDEWIEISQLEQAVEILTRFLSSHS